MEVVHETLTFDEQFPVPVTRLFRAFTDPREREAWSAPSESAEVRIDESDVRTGGTETLRCGARGELQFAGRIAYHRVEPETCIVYAEAMRQAADVMHAALVTVEFVGKGESSALRITDQVTSFVGEEGISGHRVGHTAALKNLKKRLTV